VQEELPTHKKQWYVDQYNRNRSTDEWVNDYNEFKRLMKSLSLRDGR